MILERDDVIEALTNHLEENWSLIETIAKELGVWDEVFGAWEDEEVARCANDPLATPANDRIAQRSGR